MALQRAVRALLLVAAHTSALSPLALHARRHAQPRASVSEGLDAESDSVGPGIYGGRVVIGDDGEVVIGQQFEEHNPLPGPVYAGGGYTALSSAIRTSPEEVGRVLAEAPELAFEVTTGGATPLHVCAMSASGARSMALLVDARGDADIDATDTWGYTALQRCATNNLADGARALLAAGACRLRPSGLEGTGDSARDMALRFRAFGVLRECQQHELAMGLPLPDGEIEL